MMESNHPSPKTTGLQPVPLPLRDNDAWTGLAPSLVLLLLLRLGLAGAELARGAQLLSKL